ncbi:MAG: peptide deformylase [Planctomycetota bacterium]
MADRLEFDLTFYPDPLLRRTAAPVERFDAELEAIAEAMLRRMAASQGVGLAAPQVGLARRILVLNPTGNPADELVLVNPRILSRGGPPTVLDEGCLSFPGIYAEIERPDECTVEASSPRGERIAATFAGFTSRVIQHEYDHLEGVLLVDRMSPADKLRHKAALEELVASYRRRRAAAAGSRVEG